MKTLAKKIIPKNKQIVSGTKYVVKKRMLYTTRECQIKDTVSFLGQYLEPGDELALKGYYWSGEARGGQYLVFWVLTGKAKGKEAGVYTKEEYKNLVRVNEKKFS